MQEAQRQKAGKGSTVMRLGGLIMLDNGESGSLVVVAVKEGHWSEGTSRIGHREMVA